MNPCAHAGITNMNGMVKIVWEVGPVFEGRFIWDDLWWIVLVMLLW